jgi:Cytochrome b562
MRFTRRLSALALAASAVAATVLLTGGIAVFAQDAPSAAPAKAPTQEAQESDAAPARGGARRPGQEGGGARGARGENPSVGSSMKSMNRALESLKGSIGDPMKLAENLKLIGEMERGCILAKNAPFPADLLKDAADDAAKAKVATHYRKDMIKLTQSLLELELAVMNGKTADAQAMLVKLDAAREHGHEEFGVEDDED